jgi:hypothetical protein
MYEPECKFNEAVKAAIAKMMQEYVTEMEHYSYYGSNPGVPESEIEEIAERIVKEFM